MCKKLMCVMGLGALAAASIAGGCLCEKSFAKKLFKKEKKNKCDKELDCLKKSANGLLELVEKLEASIEDAKEKL